MNPFDAAWFLLKQGDPEGGRDPVWPPMHGGDMPLFGNFPPETRPPPLNQIVPNDPLHESPFDRNPNPYQPRTITVDCPHCKGTGKTEIQTGGSPGPYDYR